MAQNIEIPTIGESITEGVIGVWTKADGEWVERDETVLELETDKITMELPAPAAGILKHGAAEGDTVAVGASVGTIDDSAEKPAGATAAATSSVSGSMSEGGTAVADPPIAVAAPAAAPAPAPAPSNGDVRATPLAKKLAEEQHIDLHGVQGTGTGGKVREHDVLAAVQQVPAAVVASIGPAPTQQAGVLREATQEKMSPMRQKIASRLVEAQQTAAMLTTFNEVDMSAVMSTRKQYKEPFAEKHGVGLGFMSFFVKAAASALQSFPLVNAYVVQDQAGKPAIEKHNYQDIAIAVSSKKGLVVPVLRNTERMTFADVESGIKDFAVRAKDGKLGLDEMQGGTFTITNGGIFGSLLSTPILNPPQSAILGMHGIKKRAVEDPANPGQIVLRPMMYLALSYDHRIVDGADAVRFLVHIKDAIEDPKRLLLDL